MEAQVARTDRPARSTDVESVEFDEFVAAYSAALFRYAFLLTADEDEATMGEKIVLAPFLEPQRAQIVANLKPID